jgi:hypothetical protein
MVKAASLSWAPRADNYRLAPIKRPVLDDGTALPCDHLKIDLIGALDSERHHQSSARRKALFVVRVAFQPLKLRHIFASR